MISFRQPYRALVKCRGARYRYIDFCHVRMLCYWYSFEFIIYICTWDSAMFITVASHLNDNVLCMILEAFTMYVDVDPFWKWSCLVFLLLNVVTSVRKKFHRTSKLHSVLHDFCCIITLLFLHCLGTDLKLVTIISSQLSFQKLYRCTV